MQKPALPKGTRDFLPDEVIRRNYIFQILKSVFSIHGFVPIETPSLELMQSLTGKYGEEGDRLLFKILNSGNFLEDIDPQDWQSGNAHKIAASIAKRGLRYDLTVPLARFVVMNRDKISFPFKRYQIQPVWRADRPQKGRYQEFYQCDCDVIGSKSLWYEADLISIYSEVFSKLQIPVEIKINHRGILMGMAEALDIGPLFIPMTMCIDKLDKIGSEKVKADLIALSLTPEKADALLHWIQIKEIAELPAAVLSSPSGAKAYQDLQRIMEYTVRYELKQDVVFDPSLARGLSYYTGFIVEVKGKNMDMGSLGGGGRYDNLTGSFGLPDIPGVGISFGAERIYDIMESHQLFPTGLRNPLKVLVICLDDAAFGSGLEMVISARAAGISTDLYPEVVKLNKSMKYANDLKIPYTILIGSSELESNNYSFKNMMTGIQESKSKQAILDFLLSDIH
jgi:histidyl-tRNA synthetase